jgi:hypothetical protein
MHFLCGMKAYLEYGINLRKGIRPQGTLLRLSQCPFRVVCG